MAAHAVKRRKAAGKPAQEPEKKQERKPDEKAKRAARMPAWLQRKMSVSEPGDALEQEAEQVARAVAKPAEDKKQAAPGAKPEGKPEAKKEAPKAQRKEIDADAKLEQERKKEAGKAAAGAKDDAATKEGEKAKRRPAISRMPAGTEAGAFRRARTTEPEQGRRTAGDDVEQRVASQRGGGAPLPPQARADMEGRFGQDFSGVRVHHGGEGQSLSRELDAHAFTVGNDVFFAPGQFAPGTEGGDHLLAHELTHVVQQGGGGSEAAAPTQLAREKKDGKGAKGEEPGKVSDDGKEYTSPAGRVNKEKQELDVAEIKLPKLKAGFIPNADFILPPKRERSDTQRAEWEKHASEEVADPLDAKIGTTKPVKIRDKEVWYLRIGSQQRYVAGTKATIRRRVGRPYWNKGGEMHFYDVDHQKEWQLGGEDTIDNLWLMDSSANRSFGSRIDKTLTGSIESVLGEARGPLKMRTSADTVRGSRWTVTLKKIVPGESIDGQNDRYTLKEIGAGKSVAPLQVLDQKAVKKAGLEGSSDKLTLFTNPAGGRALEIPLVDGKAKFDRTIKLGNFDLMSVDWSEGSGGTIAGTAFRDDKYVRGKPIKADIIEHEAVAFGGMISQASLSGQASSLLEAKGMSPIKLDSVELSDQGIVADGVIEPSIPALKGASVDLSIRGDSITISKTFSADAVKLPGPVQMTGGALTVFAGTKGIGIEGSLGFEVEKLCKGTIKAGAGMSAGGAGFTLDATCNVREDLFDPNELKFHYEASEGGSKLSGSAKLGIKTDKLKFVKSATASVTVEDDKWGVDGTVELDIPGTEEAKLTVGRSPDGEVTIGGDVAIAGKGPLKGGKLKATLTKGDGGWKAKANGTATLAVPGLDAAEVTVDYDDGAFTAAASLAYKKGMLNGSIKAGVTNRALDETGQPTGAATEELIVFGNGSVTLQIAPWLKGTVGILLKPNGEVEITGEVALPSAIDLFPEKRFDKNLFSIGIDIPIVGVSVLGQRIGIFATIGGGLDFSAGVGPGQLKDARLKVKYNPAHEDETQVDGHALFAIPADVGLRLKIHGGIGVGIPIVSATAGLEVGGKVGIKGEASAEADVHWDPKEGVKLHAEGKLSAQPAFTFDVSGYVEVEADLLLTTVTLYEKRWNLASFEYGSGLEFSVTFPVDYDEKNGLDLSLDKIAVKYPDIDAGSVLSGLLDQI